MSAGLSWRVDTASEQDLLGHLTACAALFSPPLGERVDLAAYAAKLRQRATTFEAWDGPVLAGLVASYHDGAARAAFVTSVSVLPALQRAGLGRALLQRCLDHARALRCQRLTLEVSEQSAGAIALYQRLGLHETARREGRVWMAIDLEQSEGGPPMRDHSREHQDREDRKYAYGFDGVIRRFLLRRLARFLDRSGRALELGSFRGDMTEQILGYFDHVTVIEAASELAAGVQARFGERVRVVNATFETAAPEGRFDSVFLVHTLEHLDDPVGVLRRIRSWLAPGGHLFVAVPNAHALSRQLAVQMGLVAGETAVTPAEAAHGHRCTYSRDLLLQQLAAAGYLVVEEGGVVLKPLANFQFDQALAQGIVGEAYLEACDALSRKYPELSASLYAVCAPGRAP